LQEKEEISGNVFDIKILRKLFVFVRPYRGTFFLIVILTISAGLLSPLRPLLVKYILDDILVAQQYQYLELAIFFMVFILVTQGLVEYYNGLISGKLGQSIVFDIRKKLYEHILQFKLSYFDKTPIGRLITRNISDVETISDIFTEGLADIIASIFQIVTILGIMLYLDWRLTLVSLSVIPFLIFSTYIFKEKVKKSFNEVRNAVANLNTFIQEHITGMGIVQIFTAEKREFEKFSNINKQHKNAQLKSVLYYSIYFPVAEVLSATGIGLLVWYGAREVLQEKASIGLLTSFIMYINLFFRPIREIADKFNTLQMGIVGSNRVFKILDSTEHLPKSGNVITPILGNIEFKNVYFSYSKDKPILSDISFRVPKGSVLAIVGSTGSGKSTIINLINRFYDYEHGAIKIDNVLVQDYDITHLRNHIGVVLQDVFLFSDSIRNNITLGNKAITDQQILNAAQSIGALSFIEQLPEKLDYQVMERGATLSVGQRQLISFIRVMVYNPTILVLDEATASIDTETEIQIQKALEIMMKGRTSIVIAHRLSTIKKANNILVLENGKIVEQGDHRQLLEMQGRYAQLIA
jgi:ATP-binding cassette subfamily B protein